MKSTLPTTASSALKVEEFLRFRQLQSQASLASTLKTSQPDREQLHQKQSEMRELRKRNESKQNELDNYQRQYDKLSVHVRDAIYELKSEQDGIEQQIEQLRLHKRLQQEEATAGESKQRLNDLMVQIDMCRADKVERVERYQQEIQQMDRLIEDEKRQFKELLEKVGENESWLLGLQQKHQGRKEPVDARTVRHEIELIKASNSSIMKEQAAERKRFRKESEDVRKQLKEYTDRSEERTKGWLKKCEAVVDGKKEWKDVLPESFYMQGSPEMMTTVDVEAQYLGELQAIGMLYEQEERSELGAVGLLTPFNLKTVPFIIRQSQSLERLPLTELEEEIRQTDNEARELSKKIAEAENEVEAFKRKVSKYDLDIASLKELVDRKKK